ncbi:glycoside hydrolase family 105 protein [Heterobasidion irregulare TC 32-1]|uniref:Glycoside hydrolase family 105 protein n=1 Tax=Heterobasidion irregulare (strain TC 32-1) TaxID=747525 RepID=W4JQJ0_HETIT|nr:glycoside hydrolase family 105 protein [Heterobasidion irregulare TC 32-1]ETW75156.1 glycoside hydrolase family 105 protein [Heterobasidion irregulare TC 32-1]
MGSPVVSYEHGEFQWALRLLYEKTGNASYYQYIKAGVDRVVGSDGSVGGGYNVSQYQLDPLRVGPSFIYLYSQTGEEKYKKAADVFHGQLATHPRTAQGQFWHKLIYPNQGMCENCLRWLDGIYMGEVFYATYTAAFQPNNQTAWNDILLQFTLMYNNTLQTLASTDSNSTYTGLLYHGYDYSHVQNWASPDRGHSPEIWDRALGWYMMALVDVIPLFPLSHPARQTLAAILDTLVARLVAAAQRDAPAAGVWWLVMSKPGFARNYFESSGGAMFVYAVLRAIRTGLVEDADGGKIMAMKKAYEYMTENWVLPQRNGTMNWNNTVVVGSLQPGNDYDYYVSQAIDINDLKGAAAFVLASLEYELL